MIISLLIAITTVSILAVYVLVILKYIPLRKNEEKSEVITLRHRGILADAVWYTKGEATYANANLYNKFHTGLLQLSDDRLILSSKSSQVFSVPVKRLEFKQTMVGGLLFYLDKEIYTVNFKTPPFNNLGFKSRRWAKALMAFQKN